MHAPRRAATVAALSLAVALLPGPAPAQSATTPGRPTMTMAGGAADRATAASASPRLYPAISWQLSGHDGFTLDYFSSETDGEGTCYASTVLPSGKVHLQRLLAESRREFSQDRPFGHYPAVATQNVVRMPSERAARQIIKRLRSGAVRAACAKADVGPGLANVKTVPASQDLRSYDALRPDGRTDPSRTLYVGATTSWTPEAKYLNSLYFAFGRSGRNVTVLSLGVGTPADKEWRRLARTALGYL